MDRAIANEFRAIFEIPAVYENMMEEVSKKCSNPVLVSRIPLVEASKRRKKICIPKEVMKIISAAKEHATMVINDSGVVIPRGHMCVSSGEFTTPLAVFTKERFGNPAISGNSSQRHFFELLKGSTLTRQPAKIIVEHHEVLHLWFPNDPIPRFHISLFLYWENVGTPDRHESFMIRSGTFVQGSTIEFGLDELGDKAIDIGGIFALRINPDAITKKELEIAFRESVFPSSMHLLEMLKLLAGDNETYSTFEVEFAVNHFNFTTLLEEFNPSRDINVFLLSCREPCQPNSIEINEFKKKSSAEHKTKSLNRAISMCDVSMEEYRTYMAKRRELDLQVEKGSHTSIVHRVYGLITRFFDIVCSTSGAKKKIDKRVRTRKKQRWIR